MFKKLNSLDILLCFSFFPQTYGYWLFVDCKFNVLDIYSLWSIKYFSCSFGTWNHSTFKSIYTKHIPKSLMCIKIKSLLKMTLFSRFYKNCLTIYFQLSLQDLAFTFGDMFICMSKECFILCKVKGNLNNHYSLWLCLVGVFLFPFFMILAQEEPQAPYWQWPILLTFPGCFPLVYWFASLWKGARLIWMTCLSYVQKAGRWAALNTALMPEWFQVKCILFYEYMYVFCIITHKG